MFLPELSNGDNFFLFHRQYLDLFILSIKACLNEGLHAHKLWPFFQNNHLQIHYIGGETTKRASEYDVMFRFTRHISS
jgi:hypothetical protein